MSAGQVIRAGIVMRLLDFTYKELAFHISDSRCLRRFCRIGIADKVFKKTRSCFFIAYKSKIVNCVSASASAQHIEAPISTEINFFITKAGFIVNID